MRRTCSICGRDAFALDCSPLEGGGTLCAACSKTVRAYMVEATGRKVVPPARCLSVDTLRRIVAGERPPAALPGDDAVEDAFIATGAVGAFARYNDRTGRLLVPPVRDIAGLEVLVPARVVPYDAIEEAAVLDDGQPPEPGARGRCSTLVVRLRCAGGEVVDVPFLCTPQNRRGFAYAHALQHAEFLVGHLSYQKAEGPI